jgi:hypothetical protein
MTSQGSSRVYCWSTYNGITKRGDISGSPAAREAIVHVYDVDTTHLQAAVSRASNVQRKGKLKCCGYQRSFPDRKAKKGKLNAGRATEGKLNCSQT